jgi:hypothetical protein
MGFLDKVLGRKAGQAGTDVKSSELMKGWRVHEDNARGFKLSYPPDWQIEDTAQGLEFSSPGNPRTFDPALKGEAASPRLVITMGNVPDPSQNAVKELVRSRSGAFEGYKFVTHHSKSIPKASHAAFYEFQYGPSDHPFCALSAVVQAKNAFFTVTAYGTERDFNEHRGIMECVVFSFHLI